MIRAEQGIGGQPKGPYVEEADVALAPLLDKKRWHEAVVDNVEQAHQTDDYPLSVLFIDVNRFKDINDRLGHDAGDEVIVQVGGIFTLVAQNLRLERQLDHERPVDMLSGRVGGDEFAALCTADENGAQVIAARLREAFAEYLNRPENQRLQELGIGLSIGTSTLQPDMSASELLNNADVAMYRDKLSQLPELTEHQKKAIRSAVDVMSAAGVKIRLRDFPNYAAKYPELFGD